MIFQIINENWNSAFGTLEDVIWFIIFYLIALFVIAIFLKLALAFVDSKNEDFGQIFGTSLIIIIIFAILGLFIGGFLLLIIALIVMWLIISARHTESFLAAILVSVIAVVLFILVIWLIAYAFGITIIALPF